MIVGRLDSTATKESSVLMFDRCPDQFYRQVITGIETRYQEAFES